jgi:CDP-diacylglycerol--glycerol-3-phosphate 3-phosphatidyltransferase
MASIYQLKPAFQSLLRPIVKLLAKLKITANFVTVFTCLLSTALGYAFLLYKDKYILFCIMPGFLLLRMALNAVDGMLAKEHNMKTNLGAFLNELTDVFSDGILYFPFALTLGVRIDYAFLFVLFCALSEIAGIMATQMGQQRRYDGPLGKSDRAFVVGVISLLVAFHVSLKVAYMDWAFIAMAVLAFATTVNRVKKSIKGA